MSEREDCESGVCCARVAFAERVVLVHGRVVRFSLGKLLLEQAARRRVWGGGGVAQGGLPTSVPVRCGQVTFGGGLDRRYVSPNGKEFMHRISVRVPTDDPDAELRFQAGWQVVAHCCCG